MKLIKNYSEVTFAEPGDKDADNANKGRRVRVVRDFIGRDISKLHTLDIGQSNEFGRKLGIKQNTYDTDLHREFVAPSNNYDLILFSEIGEHLFNIGMIVEKCYDLLAKDGVLIVSTPRQNPSYFYQSPHHFTEYRPDRFKMMLEYYGFEVKKIKTFGIWDWFYLNKYYIPFILTGIRPLWRCLFHRSMLFYCVKGKNV